MDGLYPRHIALVCLIAIAAALVPVRSAVAQPAQIPPGEAQGAAPLPLPLDIAEAPPALRRYLADQFTRQARRTLLVSQSPQPVEYRISADLIAAARTLVPDDAELIRLEIEARVAGLQPDVAVDLARELLKIEPDDEPAQLRLALHAVNSRQDAGGRLEAYEVLLGPRAGAFSRAVRSKLAVDAALLAREQGSERLHIEYLTFATTLDPSNKEAAALYASHFLSVSDDPLERIDVLTNVVLADPYDPEALQNLSLEMVQHGAYAGAYALILHTVQLYNYRREALPLRIRIELTLAEWNNEGTQHLVDYAQDIEDTLKQRQDGEREARERMGLDPGPDIPALLPLELETLRLAASVVLRDEELIERTLPRVLQIGEASIENFYNVQEPARAERSASAMELTLLWTRLLAGRELDTVREKIELFSSPDHPYPLSERAKARFEGWLAIHDGDFARARAVLAPIVESDRHARWAMGVLEERENNDRAALAHYLHIAQRYPNTAIGTAAWFRSQELFEGDLVRSNVALEIDKEGEELVRWLVGLFPDSASYMALSVEHADTVVDPVGACALEVTIRNRSTWPLAVNNGRMVPLRILATPIVSFGNADLVDATRSEAFSLPARLRLKPGEEHTFTVNTARRLIGDVLDVSSIRRSTVRWQLTLGFSHDGRRSVASPVSVSGQTGLAPVRVLPAGADPLALLEEVDTTAGLDRARALRSAAMGASGVAMQQLSMDDVAVNQRRGVLLNGISARLEGFTEAERASAIFAIGMPMIRLTEEDWLRVLAFLGGERSSYVAMAYASVHPIRDTNHPVLRALRNAQEPWARSYARNLDDVLLLIEANESGALGD